MIFINVVHVKKNICSDCSNENLYEDENICNINNCYYCTIGNCFNNIILNKYCTECVPDEVINKIDEKNEKEDELINEYNNLLNTKSIRKNELTIALNHKGLKLRSDSKLCLKYIEYNNGDLNEIVNRMCEMKYLFDYCNMKKELNKVENEHIEIINSGYFPDLSVFEEAEYDILSNIEGCYPIKWPWL